MDGSHRRVIFSFSLTTAADVKDAKSTISVSSSATAPAPLLEVICRFHVVAAAATAVVVVVVVVWLLLLFNLLVESGSA